MGSRATKKRTAVRTTDPFDHRRVMARANALDLSTFNPLTV